MATLSDGFKDIFLAGIGAMAITGEKTKDLVDQLISKGELTVDQGKQINTELKHKAEDVAASVRYDVLEARMAAMTPEERKDRLINGEKHLGKLYRKGQMAFVRREWRGVESTARDFVGWLGVWAEMSKMVMKDPVSIAEGLFEYRWLSSYLSLPAFVDRNTMGMRGPT